MEEAFVNYLLASSALAALVQGRITWVVRPQGSALPAITLHKITAQPIYSDGGEAGLTTARLQVDCWATTYGSAKNTGRAVLDTLSTSNGATFTQDGIEFQASFAEDEEDSFERDAAGNDTYRTRLDFIIWHRMEVT